MIKVAETPPLTQSGDIRSLIGSLYAHFIAVGFRLNRVLAMDGTETMTAPLPLKSYTVVGVPAAADYEGAIIYVSNEAGGKTIAFSDGTNWRRAQDRAIVS